MKSLKVKILSRQLYRFFAIVILATVFSPSLRAQDYLTTKAEKGEGIYSLLKRYNLPPEKYLKEFIELNQSKLGRDNSLYDGQTYRLPAVNKTDAPVPGVSAAPVAPASGGTIYPIFGEKYELVVPVSAQLNGAVFYLVSGHGGPDPGAVAHYDNHILCEDEYAYDVTLRLARSLIERGALVYMITRDENDGIRDESFLKADNDERCYPNLSIPRNQLNRLRQRKDAVNQLYVQNKGKSQRLVIIHVDSRSKRENIDVFFYHDKSSKTGRKLAVNLQQTFKEKYARHQPNRGYHGTVSDRNLYVLKYSYPPAVFIELGNINHRRDQQRFMMENNRQALANWLADGLVKDYQNNK
ncbi:N-acetylmuramoyl-L-alanine amidase family protein [Gaoshiqia sediminis]|uniref:N-acetylmuramoyl-L-alanine amidase n=1 Tax=Gaoshiqia sediminis TaxID=2986998 RepID=A0AA41Y5R1_9BACT|nr:N-acetylmuramoyl-L-alanine amidase [Gaoshiqia sediminis]MCW0481393.1 N-acetylmuramoyl-L-alanine amidase [Gaoshiqia sediminis]